ncbi:replication protein H protein [Halorhabdus tiamatea SARL4B]|uniref:Replication protein H protein n=1 Tax=Halorhabdus tiamatea SARL4B TaxID=1033806 RepID=F7PN24_9EURY|nr:DUF5817 domain-containing protein [Halorhabdus tiamatea]ERJ07735.1 replication protein H protein [Halorhabdus tiamatea SARL4B]CCQ32607.1 conserved hypothetical protein [Halorhabdus tiamatea SARL4B]
MYSVVGCTECSALWVIEGRPETSQCPRCGKRRQFDLLRKFAQTETADAARQARAAMLAERQDLGEAFDGLDSYAEMEAEVSEAVIGDDEYLESKGVDSDAAFEAGRRATEGTGGSTSREEIVREALAELDDPDEDSIVEYAAERGVPEGYTQRALQSLVQAGDVSESRGTYRLV